MCEESLVAPPLLPGAAQHAVSHPEEATLVFRSLHAGADCCVLDNATMVAKGEDLRILYSLLISNMNILGWGGEVKLNGSSLQGICSRGVLSTPIQGKLLINNCYQL